MVETYTRGQPDGAMVEEVIKVLFLAGDGTPESPYRRAFKYYSTNGHFIAVVDEKKPILE